MSNLKFEHPTTGHLHEAAIVHLEGNPGTLIIDRMSGIVLTDHMERPDWADGLAAALLHEHRQFWLTRTGQYALPQLFDMRDLGWIGVNEDGTEVEIAASDEYRMDVLATRLEVDRDDGDINKALSDAEFSLDQRRTDGEVSALEDAGAELEEKRNRA